MVEYAPRLKRHYFDAVRSSLQEQHGYANPMMIPKLEKIVLNMGVGEGVKDSKKAKAATDDLTLIAGQKAVPTKARKSIAAFRLREGMAIGAKVTLRGDRMFDFLDRLITIALPRVRDFRGLSPKSFDGNGNFAMGLKEHIVFPEIDYDAVDEIRGLDVVICTTARSDGEAKSLLASFKYALQWMNRRRMRMAKKAMVERERKRRLLVERHGAAREAMRAQLADRELSLEERFVITMKLAKMPRNSSKTRLRNRCELTGRPNGYYRKLKISRIALRQLGRLGADSGHG